MTNEEITIAIAEACGWIYLKTIEDEDGEKFLIGVLKGRPSGPIVPDYCNDLNAMHEAEMVIKKDSNLWKCYESFLARIVSGDCGMFHITANQRAEAFLKTIGKWI
jgi:hypothetical protein